jgi:hypothetical protein
VRGGTSTAAQIKQWKGGTAADVHFDLGKGKYCSSVCYLLLGPVLDVKSIRGRRCSLSCGLNLEALDWAASCHWADLGESSWSLVVLIGD